MADAAIKTKKSIGLRIHDYPNVLSKAVILIGFSFVTVLFLLFAKIAAYSEAGVDFTLNGLQVLGLIFSKNVLTYIQYGAEIHIQVPFILTAIVVFGVLSGVFLAGFTYAVMFRKRNDSRLIGCFFIGYAAILLLSYLLLLTVPAFKAIAINGEKKIFYQLYEIKPAILICVFFALTAAAVQLFLRLGSIKKAKRFWVLYVLLIIPTAYILIFCLYPILLQAVLSFKDYKLSDGVWGSAWIGFGNFRQIFAAPAIRRMLLNTVYISFLRLIFGLVPPIVFSLILFELNSNRYRRVVQTIVYIPHFFSWIIIYAIVYAFLTPDGIVNNILISAFGKNTRMDFLTTPGLFIPIQIISSVWKETGWGTILYLAALSNIDRSLYEAASIDGAGAWRKLKNITFPSILPIVSFMTIMAVGNLLKGAGGEQILVFFNSAVKEQATVIDTWVYWEGLTSIKYGIGSAVSFMQSALGIIMVVICNKASKKLTGIGIW